MGAENSVSTWGSFSLNTGGFLSNYSDNTGHQVRILSGWQESQVKKNTMTKKEDGTQGCQMAFLEARFGKSGFFQKNLASKNIWLFSGFF